MTQQKATLIVLVALNELDTRWRRGTANSGFHERTLELLRPSAPSVELHVHESDVTALIEELKSGKFRLEKE